MTPDAATPYPPIADGEAEVVLAACRVLVAISAQSIAVVESDVDLTEFRVLVILATLGSARLSTLADTAEIHDATARRVCDRLIGLKFLTITEQRSECGQALTLTAQGRGVVHMVMSRRRAAIEPILAHMSAAGRTGLQTAFNEFARAAGEPSLHDLWAMGWTR